MPKHVVFSSTGASASVEEVTKQLRAGKIDIIDKQPNMLLVDGREKQLRVLVEQLEGWNVSKVTETPHPAPKGKKPRLPR